MESQSHPEQARHQTDADSSNLHTPGQFELFAEPETTRPPQDHLARAELAHAARARIRTLGIEHTRISRDSHRHEIELADERRKEILLNGPDKNFIYGAYQLRSIDTLRSSHANEDEAQIEIQLLLDTARKDLMDRIAKQPQWLPDLTYELQELEMAPALSSEMTEPEVSEILQSLSNDQIERFLRHHQEITQEKASARKGELEGIAADFLEKIKLSHANGRFPLSREEAQRRLSKHYIGFFDPWNAFPRAQGFSDYSSGIIGLNVDRHEGTLQTYIHEALHAISGVTVQEEQTTHPDQWRQRQAVQIKQGLSIIPDPDSNRAERFSWLDEAVIESLVIELGDYPADSSSYPVNREILGRLEQYVDRKYFLAAQFEDFEPDKGTPAWGELNQQLATAFEPGILLKLDKLIKRDGLEAAITYLDDMNRASTSPQHSAA